MSKNPPKYSLSLISGFMLGLRPDPTMTVNEWADAFRFLPESSARPGKFKVSLTPWAIEIMQKLSNNDPAQKIIWKKASQIAATETGNNWLGYIIDQVPCSMLYVMPTSAMMKFTSRTRIDPMINSTPALRKKVAAQKGKGKSNTMLYKEFQGGYVNMVGANSPVGLSSAAVKAVYIDELDRLPMSVGGEGSAIKLAETRTSTYGSRRKIFITSSPTRKGTSQIDKVFETTGQRYWHVPCPHCGSFQKLVIEQLRYEVGDYTKVQFQCVHCELLIEERLKPEMLGNGQWIPEHPEKEDGFTFGYHLSAMYSPLGFYSWNQMAQEREESKNNPLDEIVFINTKLGECYEGQGDKPSWEAIYDRAEDYKLNVAFKDVAVITAGVDVQGDRLEITIIGWMDGKKSQQLDYRVIIGDTSKTEIWEELGKIVYESWKREDGTILPLRLMAVDSGYNTKKVYDFAKKHSVTRVIPIKGNPNLNMMFVPPKAVNITKAGKKVGTTKVWGVGVSFIKAEIYGMLKMEIERESGIAPDGYCWFPKRDTHFFKGLTAEELQVVTSRKGYREYVWVKRYERNEPLDTFVYARAAAAVVGIDNWDNSRWERERLLAVPDPELNKVATKAPPKKRRADSVWGNEKKDVWK